MTQSDLAARACDCPRQPGAAVAWWGALLVVALATLAPRSARGQDVFSTQTGPAPGGGGAPGGDEFNTSVGSEPTRAVPGPPGSFGRDPVCGGTHRSYYDRVYGTTAVELPVDTANAMYAASRGAAFYRCGVCRDHMICWPRPGQGSRPGQGPGPGQGPSPGDRTGDHNGSWPPPPGRIPAVGPGAPRPTGADPLLQGVADAFQACGAGARQLLQVPGLMLTGNFVEAARLLGLRPGESIVLRTLLTELAEPVVGAEPTSYQVGQRIGRRLCTYGLLVEPGLPGRPPTRRPGAGSAPVSERPLGRRPSPKSFQGYRPDSVTQHGYPARTWASAEEIGEAGMAAEARARGYWELLPPQKASGVPQGFDGVYWDPQTGALVIGEAKGGYNGAALDDILGRGYGARQGTLDWAEPAAQRVTRSLKTNDLEVRYAEQFLFRALKDRKVPVRIEVFHTDVVGGAPGVTRHYVTDSLP